MDNKGNPYSPCILIRATNSTWFKPLLSRLPDSAVHILHIECLDQDRCCLYQFFYIPHCFATKFEWVWKDDLFGFHSRHCLLATKYVHICCVIGPSELLKMESSFWENIFCLLCRYQSEYRKRGFQEVVTPNIYNSKLWQTSGHWQHYGENMFSFEVEKETFALKPMNCPGHW